LANLLIGPNLKNILKVTVHFQIIEVGILQPPP